MRRIAPSLAYRYLYGAHSLTADVNCPDMQHFASTLAGNFTLKLQYTINQCFGARRATGDVDIHGHNFIHAH